MSTSVNDLKKRLRKYLADPNAGQEFRVWLALALRDAHKAKDPEFESVLHGIEQVFSDASDGLCSAEDMRGVLASFSQESSAVNQMLSMQSSPFSQSVNRWVEEKLFPASAPSGTSPGVVFGSIECHQG